jgi:RNA ligase
MKYQFPIIEHIDQVRQAIAGRDEFIEAKRDVYVVFDYRLSLGDTFPDVLAGADDRARQIAVLRREARGLIGDPRTGKVLGRRFHKFFNLGERAETTPEAVELAPGHVVLDKLDGSMVSPFLLDGRLHWATMLGTTPIAGQAAAFAARNPGYESMACELLAAGANPIFEWCSTANRVVIEHPEPRLVLLAVRDLVAGTYWPYRALVELACRHGVPVVQAWTDAPSEARAFLLKVRGFDDCEGYVVRFADGHMVKVKTAWYSRIHALKEDLALEKRVVALVLENQVDDLLPHLAKDEAAALAAFADAVRRNLAGCAAALVARAAELRSRHPARRDQALALGRDPDAKFIFAVLDGRDAYASLRDYVLRQTASSTRLEGVRRYIGARWDVPAGDHE